MCGILGGNGKWNYEKGLEIMQHRGPDDSRIVRFSEFTMCFNRLSIIDTSTNGMQPMMSADNNVCIVFNGEIYGYKSLREELLKEFKFNSNSDTEVLLNMYIKYGMDFIDKIDGIFSFAIIDKRINKLILFRDRLGVKPLFYYCHNGEILFSSEIKGITNSIVNFKKEVDYTALYDYLTYAYIPSPKTVYKNINKLEPAHRLIFDIGKRTIISNDEYWKLDVNDKEYEKRDIEDTVCHLKELIKESVSEQMIADVPVGVMTSGGVDSSIITYECSIKNPFIETYTVKNTDVRMDESEYAKELRNHLNLKGNIITYGKKELEENYQKLPNWFDEPMADRSAYLSYEISKEARKKVKVLLSGDGADELFGGYSWLFSLKERTPYKYNNNFGKLYETKSEKLCFNCGSKTNELLDEEYLDDIRWYSKRHGYMLAREKKYYRYKWNIPDDYDDYWFIRKFYHEDLPIITRLQVVELNTYLPYILNKVDITSMAASIEVRVPFLSKKILEYAFSLPQNVKFFNEQSKGLLKYAYPEIPKSILERKKMGFDISPDYFGIGKTPQEMILRQLWRF